MDVDIPIPEVGKLTDDLKELTKNSVISVTVDDLNEGLIVVSYAHHDNLYQGVLLQLNRERGIPSGISFPKDYCTGSVVEAGGENNDPTQVPPLTQRHTYFQDKDGTLLNDPVKSRLALRRVIKPPARFKNSRMSLRLRHRPVLCAKCRTLCEEKFASSQSSSSSSTTSTDKNNGSHTINSKESNNSEDDSSKKQSNSNVAPVGVSTRRSKSAECGGTSLVGTGTAEVRKEPEEDYSFVTMGTKSCVENYWKRPSLIVEENSKDQQQQQQQPKKTGSKDLILKVPRTSSRIAERNSVEETKTGGSTTAAAAAPAGPVVETKELNLVLPKFPTHKAGKSKKSSPKSIKLCISKISSSHCDIKSETVAEDPLISGPAASTILADIRDENDAKMWENRIRKRSTVPLRFRDQGYVTKNIFNFKRRRDEGLEEEDEMPELTVRLSPDQGDPPTLEGGPSNPPKLSKSSSSEISEETTTTATTPPSSAAASIQSESSSQVGSKSNASSSSEPAKTPVIKICFGTPGNGVVIQIPPKAKQEDSSASSSSSSGDKAARKAMKKAKKEARRKLSLSREASPTRSISPAVAPIPASSSSSSSTSLQPLNCDELLDPPLPPPPPQLLPSASSVVTESDEPIIVPNKKRKKEKKKKREKELKENGSGGGAGLLLSTNGHSSNDSVEIQRISPLIVTEKQVPFKEDEDNELIPSCESKSIEKHDEDESPPEDHLPTTRLCISLKRLNNENSMGWDISHNNNPSHPHQNNNNNHHSHGNINELDELDQVGSSPAHLEPGDFPPTDESLPNDQSNASSIDSFNDERRNHVYKKGDIVWGKLPGCPWWPGKILDILFVAADDVTARVSWYRASTLSCIRFSQLSPFAEQFEARYTRSRKRGSYQHAVRDALIEAHQLDPNDLPSD